MRVGVIWFCLILSIPVTSNRTMAQNLTVQEWVDQFVSTCVGSGSSDTASGSVDAGGDISLKKLTLSGTVTGQVQIAHQDAKLLTDGINNKMSAVAADVADQVRKCLAPVRAILIQVMQLQLQGPTANSKSIYILSPEEAGIIKAMATTKGYFGKTGNAVFADIIQTKTGLGDLRYNAAMRRLADKFLAHIGLTLDGRETAFLTSDGEDYALRVGFTN